MAHELVHLAFSLYFWCSIFTPFQLQTASVKDKQKKNKGTSLDAYLTCFCTMHARNESTAKDVSCPHWKCSFCSSPWNNAWSAIPVTVCLYFCGIVSISSVWGRDIQKGHKEGWSEYMNACFLLQLHNEYMTSDKIMMEVYLESCTEVVKQLLCMLLLLNQVKQLKAVWNRDSFPVLFFAF